jgi:hypothetical protein
MPVRSEKLPLRKMKLFKLKFTKYSEYLFFLLEKNTL